MSSFYDKPGERLWATDVFVDADAGVNTAIRKVRRALGESAERPVYIDTVPRKGYRFVAPVISVAAATHVTIAVLPFANLSGDPSHEYLADGLTEETIAALGQVDPDRLSVIGRTSTVRYRNTRKSLQEIARELCASYVVESSIRGRPYDARDVHLVFAPVDPKCDPYRGERRFQEVMSRCGFTR